MASRPGGCLPRSVVISRNAKYGTYLLHIYFNPTYQPSSWWSQYNFLISVTNGTLVDSAHFTFIKWAFWLRFLESHRLECWGCSNVSTDLAVTVIRVSDFERVGLSYEHLSLGSASEVKPWLYDQRRRVLLSRGDLLVSEGGDKKYFEFGWTLKRGDEKCFSGHVVNEKRR
jgi:hypothetical protein